MKKLIFGFCILLTACSYTTPKKEIPKLTQAELKQFEQAKYDVIIEEAMANIDKALYDSRGKDCATFELSGELDYVNHELLTKRIKEYLKDRGDFHVYITSYRNVVSVRISW